MASERIIQTVAVVGTGTIGASWAAHFLAKGFAVAAHDPAPGSEQRLRTFVDTAWPVLRRLGLNRNASRARLIFYDRLEAAASVADFVQESGPEDLAEKRGLYAKLDAVLPADVIIASSSSGIRIGEVQTACRYPERCVIGHPFNPPHLLPLVEVVGGALTHDRFLQQAMDFYRSTGKHAIRLNKEVKGHIANRLQAALWREAIHLINEGVGNVDDVDAAVAYGPGLRWALMGPSLTFHLGGGPGGLTQFLKHLGGPVQEWWDDLGTPRLSKQVKEVLVKGMEQQLGDAPVAELAQERDELLLGILSIVQAKRSLP